MNPSQDVMRGFNRNTMWVATGVLGTVVFAALVLAVQERQPMVADLAEKVMKTPNASTAAPSNVVGSTQITPAQQFWGQATSINHGLTPEINHLNVQNNASSWSPAQSQDTARVIRPKIANVKHRSSIRHRFVDVKMRLIELWHQSLARNEKSSGWAPFSTSKKGEKKKVSYTAEMSH
jgi:hypothetical protein